MSRSPYQKQANDITQARPHHRLVEDMELLFIGSYQKRKSSQFPVWRVVNEWMVIASLCLIISAVADFILRF